MGQIFHACVYDIESRTCSVTYADKFHANCYTYSGAVAATHYLLRQKPYHVMWGGDYIAIDNALVKVINENVLLGISTYEDYEGFERNNKDLYQKPYYDKVKFIDENSKTWEHISVGDEALELFNMKKTRSVPFNGYLLNHTKNLVINLFEYYKKSIFLGGEDGYEIFAIDPIPVLTETGGGAQMAYLEGTSAASTDEFAGSWCGDLLQIVDSLPNGYEVIKCCFADMWRRADFCYRIYGLNDEGLIREGRQTSLYEATPLTLFGERGTPRHVKVEVIEDKIRYSTVPIQ